MRGGLLPRRARRYRAVAVFVLSRTAHVFGIRTPVSAILAATIGNVCIYVCAAFTGYAIADVLND